MLKIEIKDAAVSSERVNGKNGAFEARQQKGVVELPNGERRVIRIRLQRDHGGYAAGVYTVADSSYTVSQYGDLQVQYLNLEAVRVAPALSAGRAV
jgi:hypothetical protein